MACSRARAPVDDRAGKRPGDHVAVGARRGQSEPAADRGSRQQHRADHGHARRVPRADRGGSARAVPWLERLVGFDKLTNWHRWNGHACLWLILAHVVPQHLGLQLTDFPPKSYFGRDGAADLGDVLPGMITATVGTALLVAVVAGHVGRDRAAAPAVRALVRRAPHRVRGNRARLVPPDPNGERPDHIAPARVVLAQPLRRDAGPGRLAGRGAVHQRLPAPAARLRGRAGGPGGHLAPDRRPSARQDARGARASSSSGGSSRQRLLVGAAAFSLSAAPDGKSLRITVKSSRQPLGEAGPARAGHAGRRRGPVRRLHRGVAHQEKVLLVAGGIGITPIRALIEEMEGDIVVLYRVVSEEDLVFREELDAARRGTRDHGPQRGRRPHDARRDASCFPGAPEGARSRRGRTRGIPLRSHRVHRRARERAPPRRRPATQPPHRAIPL